jgi:hypothetical protein
VHRLNRQDIGQRQVFLLAKVARPAPPISMRAWIHGGTSGQPEAAHRIGYAPDPAVDAALDEGPGLAQEQRVEAQGGAIRIEDNTPRGRVFVVELPR